MSLNLDKSAWKRIAFGDVIDSITDRVDNPTEAGVDRYVGLEHLDPGVMTVQRWDSPDKVEAQKLRFQNGDVIFGRRRAYQKKVAKAEFEGICSAHALVLRGRPDYMSPDFLSVFLSSDYFLERAIEISVGSLSPTVNWRDLKVQEFEFPPVDDQRRIADLVWAIERDRRASDAVASSAQGVFRRLLEEMCIPSSEDEISVGAVVDVLDGRRIPLSATERAKRPGSVPYYGAGGQIDSVDEAIFDEPLVLLCEDGFGLAAWDKRPIAYLIEGPSWVNNHAHVFRARDVSTEWLLYSLMHYDLTPYVSTTVKPKLNLSTAKALRIRKTPEEQQYVTILGEARCSVEAAKARVVAAVALRSSLLAAIFGAQS